MQTQRPRLLVIDDDQAVLTLVGTGVNCLDVLKVLRTMSPQGEVVLTTGYATLDQAVEAIRPDIVERGAAPMMSPPAPPGPSAAPLVEIERDHIIRTLAMVHGNKAVAARLLGISRRALYRQLERHGLHQRVPAAARAE